MSGVIRFLGLLLGMVFVGVIIGVGIAGRSPLDATAYRERLAELASEILGEPVQIDGRVTFSLLPTPFLNASGVRWEHDGQEQTAAELRLEPALPALLRGEVRAAALTLVRPRLHVRQTALARALMPGTGAGAGAGAQSPIAGGRLRLEEGEIVLLEPGADAAKPGAGGETLRAVTLEGEWPNPATATGNRLHLRSSMIWREQSWSLELAAAAPSSTGAVPLNLSLRWRPVGADPQATASGRFAGLLAVDPADASLARLQGEVRIDADEAETVLGALDSAGDLTLPPPPEPRPLHLRTLLELTRHQIQIQNLELTVGSETRLSGRLSATLAADPPPPAGSPATGPEPLPGWQAELGLNLNRLGAREQHRLLAGFTALTGLFRAEAAEPLRRSHLRFMIDSESLPLEPAVLAAGLPVAPPLSHLPLTEIHLDGVAADGGVQLRQATFRLPGNGRVLLAGRIGYPQGQPQDDAEPAVDLTAEFTADNLRAILEKYPLDLGGIAEDRLRRVVSHIHYQGGLRHGRIPGFDLSLDSLSLIASGSFDHRNAPPLYTLTAEGDHLDLDAYGLGPWLLARGQEWLHTLQTDPKAASLNARLALKSVHLAGQVWPTLSGEGQWEHGRLAVNPLQIRNASGLSVWLKGAVDATAPTARSELQFSLDSPGLASLTPWLAAVPGFRLPPGLPEPGALRLSGRVSRHDDDAIHLEAGLNAESGTLTLNGQFRDWDSLPSFDGRVRISHPQGSVLLQHLMPAWGLNTDGTLDLYAEISGSLDVLNANAVQGQVAGVTVRGDFLLDRTGDRPRLDAELVVGDLSLDRLLPGPHPLRETAIGLIRPLMLLAPATLPATGDGPAPPMPARTNPGLEGRLDLAANRLTLNGLALDDLRLGLEVTENELRLAPLNARIHGGQAHLGAVLNPAAGTATYDVIVANVPLSATRLLPLFADPAPLTLSAFRADARGRVTVSGPSPDAIQAEGNVVLEGGLISGFGLARLLDAAAAIPDTLRDPDAVAAALTAAAQGGETAFSRAGGRVIVGEGRLLRLEDGQIAAMGGHIGLSGTLGLKPEAATAAFAATIQATGRREAGLPPIPPLLVSLDASGAGQALTRHAASPALSALLLSRQQAEAARRQAETEAAEAARRQAEAEAAEAARRQAEAEAARRQAEAEAAEAAEAARRQAEAEAAEAARRQAEDVLRPTPPALPAGAGPDADPPPAPAATPPARRPAPRRPPPASAPSGTPSGTPSPPAPDAIGDILRRLKSGME